MKDDQDSPTYAGIRSMLRMAYEPFADGWEAGQVCVVGVPFDLAVTNRPGSRFGPAAIRDASLMVSDLTHYPTGHRVAELGVDTGDALLDAHNPHSIPAAITARINQVLAADCIPLSLGGDHYITLPILRAVTEKHGPVALVHFDAHSDTWEPQDAGEPQQEMNHGSMFVYALREGLIDVDRTIQVGIRTHNPDTRGITIIDAPDMRRLGPAAVADRIREQVGDGAAYLTFDIDFLDPAFAPGTGTPVPGGATTGDAQDIIRGLGGIHWVGADVVEVAPSYDGTGQITALAGATIAAEWLALLAAARV
ncbi:MAG: agmatinase [Acidimicrobiia bacterium]|nr:agmatinase [Acidimicrobiia bacterium]